MDEYSRTGIQVRVLDIEVHSCNLTKSTSNPQLYKFEIMGFDKFRSKFGTGKQKHQKIAIIFKSVRKLRHSRVVDSNSTRSTRNSSL